MPVLLRWSQIEVTFAALLVTKSSLVHPVICDPVRYDGGYLVTPLLERANNRRSRPPKLCDKSYLSEILHLKEGVCSVSSTKLELAK
jgi:hypothetical protein